jgi:hypothetical protein
MNFKALALGTVLTLGSIFGTVAPASAGTCWFERGNTGRMAATYCQTNSRINNNGHRVLDVVDHQGTEFTLVFWTDQIVEIIGIEARPIQASWYTDSQGDRRIEVGNFEMAIRL